MTLRLDRALLITLVIALVVTALAPFGQILIAASLGRSDLRIIEVALMALIGAALAQRLGLRLDGHSARSPFVLGMIVAALMAVRVVALDVWLFRSLLDPG